MPSAPCPCAVVLTSEQSFCTLSASATSQLRSSTSTPTFSACTAAKSASSTTSPARGRPLREQSAKTRGLRVSGRLTKKPASSNPTPPRPPVTMAPPPRGSMSVMSRTSEGPCVGNPASLAATNMKWSLCNPENAFCQNPETCNSLFQSSGGNVHPSAPSRRCCLSCRSAKFHIPMVKAYVTSLKGDRYAISFATKCPRGRNTCAKCRSVRFVSRVACSTLAATTRSNCPDAKPCSRRSTSRSTIANRKLLV
mmetsp:Transcript_54395/g.176833  ORF Transcript_54395/g.176833 Transcript_54395/m.176833 type:complete len:252 (-) Transcript_54395:376-1131(-)